MSAPVTPAGLAMMPPAGPLPPATTFCGRIMQVFDPDCWTPANTIAKICLVAVTVFTTLACVFLTYAPLKSLVIYCFGADTIEYYLLAFVTSAALACLVYLVAVSVARGVGFLQ